MGLQRHSNNTLQSLIMLDSVLSCAKDTETDVSSSDDTTFNIILLKRFISDTNSVV